MNASTATWKQRKRTTVVGIAVHAAEVRFLDRLRKGKKMSEIKLRQARNKFEEHLIISGIPFNWDGKRYDRVNVQTEWRYFCLGYFANTKD